MTSPNDRTDVAPLPSDQPKRCNSCRRRARKVNSSAGVVALPMLHARIGHLACCCQSNQTATAISSTAPTNSNVTASAARPRGRETRSAMASSIGPANATATSSKACACDSCGV